MVVAAECNVHIVVSVDIRTKYGYRDLTALYLHKHRIGSESRLDHQNSSSLPYRLVLGAGAEPLTRGMGFGMGFFVDYPSLKERMDEITNLSSEA